MRAIIDYFFPGQNNQEDSTKCLTPNEVRIYKDAMNILSYLSDIKSLKLSSKEEMENMVFSIKCTVEQIKILCDKEPPRLPEEASPPYDSADIVQVENNIFSSTEWLKIHEDYILDCINYMSIEFCNKVLR